MLHNLFPQIYTNIGLVLIAMKDFPQAKISLDNAQAIFLKNKDLKSYERARLDFAFGMYYFEQNQMKEAERNFNESLKIYQASISKENFSYLMALAYLVKTKQLQNEIFTTEMDSIHFLCTKLIINPKKNLASSTNLVSDILAAVFPS